MSKSMYGAPPALAADMSVAQWSTRLAPLGARKLKVLWDISNKCNLRCRMCHFSYGDVFQREAEFTRPEDFERIAAEVLPAAHTLVLSAANEPLTSPWFADILRIVARYNIPNIRFITNGQRLNEAIVEAVLESGVTQVQISIDGATKETYEYIRRGGNFEKLVANLTHLTRRKRELGRALPQLQFNIVLMQRNVEELERFVDLAEKVGVEWLAARHLLVMKGLNMEAETLSRDPAWADRFFKKFLARVDRSPSVSVITFPDLFDPTSLDHLEQARSSAPAGKEAVPFGCLDSPVESEVAINNAVQFEGWALDARGVREVTLERDPTDGESPDPDNPRGRITLGRAHIPNGSRPDVGKAYPDYPLRYRAGWMFELRREMLSSQPTCRAVVYAVATNFDGRSEVIGQRTIVFAADRAVAPFLFCARPFDSIYIDAKGDVFPYADCVTPRYGSFAKGDSFADIWVNEDFTELRTRVINRDPPRMCLKCAQFINWNVDDPNYFGIRPTNQFEGGFRE